MRFIPPALPGTSSGSWKQKRRRNRWNRGQPKRRRAASLRAFWRKPGVAFSVKRSCSVVVGVVFDGDVADFLQGHVAEKFAVFENGVERVALWNRIAVDDFDGDKFLSVLN